MFLLDLVVLKFIKPKKQIWQTESCSFACLFVFCPKMPVAGVYVHLQLSQNWVFSCKVCRSYGFSSLIFVLKILQHSFGLNS